VRTGSPDGELPVAQHGRSGRWVIAIVRTASSSSGRRCATRT